jgi:hypothetical protein
MTQPADDRVPVPEHLLRDVPWTFRGEPFRDRAAFVKAVCEHCNPEFTSLQAVQQALLTVVLCVPRVHIEPDVWLWHESKTPVLELTPDDGVAFTGAELLFKIHNAWVSVLRRMDHKYFEGFTLSKRERKRGAPPLYELNQGS